VFPIQYDIEVFDGFRRFLTVNKQLTGRTVRSHLNLIGRFYEEFDGREVTQKEIQEYLMKIENKNTYRNNLSTLRVFFRDFKQIPWRVERFRFPRVMLLPKAIPSKQELRTFFDAIDGLRDRAIFLMFASSGLRRQELLGLRRGEITLEKRMLTPATKGMTKLGGCPSTTRRRRSCSGSTWGRGRRAAAGSSSTRRRTSRRYGAGRGKRWGLHRPAAQARLPRYEGQALKYRCPA
jgi:integrase